MPVNATDNSGREGLRNMSRKSEDVAEYYDDWADDYDRTLAQWRYEAPEQVAARLHAALDSDAVILDAGCGTGLSGRALAHAGFQTIDGMDVSRRSLDRAGELGIYRSLKHVDMQRLPLPYGDDSYDGLVCVGVLTYVPDSLDILTEFCRIVKTRGLMVLTQRSDLLEERDFPATLETMEHKGLLSTSHISDPMPYLPQNEEFRDDVLVHYITCHVA
jgi:predicted TPR repeat methyltransferase